MVITSMTSITPIRLKDQVDSNINSVEGMNRLNIQLLIGKPIELKWDQLVQFIHLNRIGLDWNRLNSIQFNIHPFAGHQDKTSTIQWDWPSMKMAKAQNCPETAPELHCEKCGRRGYSRGLKRGEPVRNYRAVNKL